MGIGIKELVVILIIVLLLFGTKRLKSIGTDLGAAIKGFRKSVQDDEASSIEHKDAAQAQQPTSTAAPDKQNVDPVDKP